MNEIYLKDIWTIYRPGDYKAHFAKDNGDRDPLVEWCKDTTSFVKWQTWQGERKEFNRKFIFSMMRFEQEPQNYLFAGVFEVIEPSDEKDGHNTKVKLTEQGEQFIGRLILQTNYDARNVRPNFENHYAGEPKSMLVVKEILRSQYTCD